MNPYLTDRGRAALEVAGWPEWNEPLPSGFMRRRLIRNQLGDWQKEFYSTSWVGYHVSDTGEEAGWGGHESVSDHIATCIINEHLRTWLENKGVWVEPLEVPSRPGRIYRAMKRNGLTGVSIIAECDSYANVLILAVLGYKEAK